MKRSELWVIAIASVIAILIEKSFAIRCWTCNSQTATESFCDDPFDSSVVYSQNRRWTYTDCVLPPISQYNPYGSSSYNGNNGNNGGYSSYNDGYNSNRLRPVCQKSRDRINGRIFVNRKCTWVNDYDPYDKCMNERTPSYMQREFCEYCDSDGCNGAAQYGPMAALFLIPIALLKFSLF